MFQSKLFTVSLARIYEKEKIKSQKGFRGHSVDEDLVCILLSKTKKRKFGVHSISNSEKT